MFCSSVCNGKSVLVGFVGCVDVQSERPCCPYPFCGHADELEDESLDTAGLLQSEGFRVESAHEEPVEVAYECREQEEHGVLLHERLWQPCPSEPVVHVVEDSFLAAPEVVELHYLTRA